MTVRRAVKLVVMLSVGLVVTGLSAVAFAQGAGQSADAARAGATGWIGLGAGIGMGLAAFGAGMGQGRATAAFLDGVARNPGARPQVFTAMILGLALIESLAIYALVVSILLWTKI
jgi:F-type H+-transporting ATPase subunit c